MLEQEQGSTGHHFVMLIPTSCQHQHYHQQHHDQKQPHLISKICYHHVSINIINVIMIRNNPILSAKHARARAGINRSPLSCITTYLLLVAMIYVSSSCQHQHHHVNISIITIFVIINIIITNKLILSAKMISIVIRSSLPSPCFSTLRRVRGERGIRTKTLLYYFDHCHLHPILSNLTSKVSG